MKLHFTWGSRDFGYSNCASDRDGMKNRLILKSKTCNTLNIFTWLGPCLAGWLAGSWGAACGGCADSGSSSEQCMHGIHNSHFSLIHSQLKTADCRLFIGSTSGTCCCGSLKSNVPSKCRRKAVVWTGRWKSLQKTSK